MLTLITRETRFLGAKSEKLLSKSPPLDQLHRDTNMLCQDNIGFDKMENSWNEKRRIKVFHPWRFQSVREKEQDDGAF